MTENNNNPIIEPGTEFLEYTIEQVLGSGNFGIVYKAANRFLDETVAIKEFFPKELAYRSPDFRVVPKSSETEGAFRWALDRFLKEARILWSLSRPNLYPSIIQVKSYREGNGTAYMIMEYAAGEPLSNLIERHEGLTHDRIELILNPLLDGLERVHNASVLHRDIKPSNILIRPDGSPVLIDFGAAKPDIDSSAKSTVVMYTPLYAPPEQIVPEGQLGAWTDIYSLGATLYHAVTGRPPINPVTRIQGLAHVRAMEAASGRYPENLLKAIDAAIEPIYTNRPQSISALRNIIYPSNTPNNLDATIVTHHPTPRPPIANANTVFASVASVAPLKSPEQPRSFIKPTFIKGTFVLIFLAFLFGGTFYLNHKPTVREESTEPQTIGHPIESISEEINRRLTNFDCALLESRLKNDYSLEVTGYMGNAENLQRLRNSLVELSQIKNIKTDIKLDLEPFCKVIRLYKKHRNILSEISNHTVTLDFNHPDQLYTNGDILFINAISNTPTKGYLYVDFFDREGNVIHMLPSPIHPTNSLQFREEIFLGEKHKAKDFENKRSYEILPPFGTHIVTTLFSESPLYNGLRPESEAIDTYLKAMEPILQAIPDEEKPAGSIEIIKTRDST